MLQNPPILILDEATSSLDSITENRLQETLSMKRLDRTVLIVAHRLSTIADADCIIVVENGNILETGTHNDLLKLNGKYSALWRKQASGSTVEELEGSSQSAT
jgi:ABC-type multidrug transport system fused ATPase/permease subunit